MTKWELDNYKKLKGKEVNLVGFETATSEDQACSEALAGVPVERVPVVLDIKLESDGSYFRIDRREFTPYADTEDCTLLQDGMCLKVKSVTREKVKIEGQNK